MFDFTIDPSSGTTYGYFRSDEFKLSQTKFENFKTFQLSCKTVLVANYLRLKAGRLRINSCGRTPSYNSTLNGSAPNSQHLILPDRPVTALDLKSLDISNSEFKQIVLENRKALRCMGMRGVGFYKTFIHIDCRPTKSISAWGMDSVTKNKFKNTTGFFSL